MTFSTRVIVALVGCVAVLPAASAAQPVPPPVGYVVKVILTAGEDSTVRRIDVSKRCLFRYRGGGRGFGEGGVWELRLRDGRWYLGRRLEDWIT